MTKELKLTPEEIKNLDYFYYGRLTLEEMDLHNKEVVANAQLQKLKDRGDIFVRVAETHSLLCGNCDGTGRYSYDTHQVCPYCQGNKVRKSEIINYIPLSDKEE